VGVAGRRHKLIGRPAHSAPRSGAALPCSTMEQSERHETRRALGAHASTDMVKDLQLLVALRQQTDEVTLVSADSSAARAVSGREPIAYEFQ